MPLSLVLALLLAQPAIAPGQAGAPTPPSGASPMSTAGVVTKGSPQEVVCRTITPTGTRVGGERTCHTRQEWADLTASAREATWQTQNLRAGGPH